MEKVILERMKSFWGDARFYDISFTFADSEEILKANKMILTLVSPVFEAMFYGDFVQEDPVPITDIGYDTFRDFLHFIYTEDIKVASLEDAQKLFYVAHKYEVVSAEAACERYIIKNIKNFNPEEVQEFAEMFSLKNLEWLSRLLKDHSPDTALPVSWVPYKKGDPVPTSMSIIGVDEDGYPIGVGRFKVEIDLIPGTFHVKKGYVDVGYGCKGHRCDDGFEILCNGALDWIESEDGKDVPNSVDGGRANNYHHERLGVGKIVYNGKLVIGKVHHSHRCMYIPWQEAELKVNGKYFHLIDNNAKKTHEEESEEESFQHEEFDEDDLPEELVLHPVYHQHVPHVDP